jgi:hypothetical protein
VDVAAEAVMVEGAREVCLSDLTRVVDPYQWRDVKQSLGYGKLRRIECATDIGCYKSTYSGKACVYLELSTARFIFCEIA